MIGRRLFRLLLLLYPARFREQFGTNILAAFDAGRMECRSLGEVAAFWVRIIADFLKTVPRAHWGDLTGRRAGRDTPKKRERELMFDLLKDVQLAFRILVRKPGPGFIAILALALGIGLTSSMFSIVNGVILKGLPVEDPNEVMGINRVNPAEGPNRLTGRIHDYYDLQERQTTFTGLAAASIPSLNVSSPDATPDFVNGADVTANIFTLLRVPPTMGRTFTANDEILGAPSVAVIGHRFWEDRFNADPGVLGQIVRINGVPTEIIGVMPDGFEFPFIQQLWRPLRVNTLELERGAGPGIFMMGRLGDGVSMRQAQADLGRIMTQLGAEHPDTNEGMSVVIGPYVSEFIGYQMPGLLYTMLGAVSLVLLIACANVANLLLARASLRSKEIALKSALGASRGRVVVQLLMDSSIIAVLGGTLGIGIALVGIEAFNRALGALPQGVPYWFDIELDPTVMLFVLFLTLTAALLSGLIPAVRASRADINAILKDNARGSSSLRIGRLSRGLVILEVAFSCTLLVAAGLMVKSVTNISQVDYAFDGDAVFTALMTLPSASYPGDAERLQFYSEIEARLEGQPGILSSSLTTELPAVGFGNGRFEIEGREYLGDRDYPSARIGSVDPSYFETLSADLLEGRPFEKSDDERATPVAIVNRKFAQTYFEGESVLGKRVSLHRVSQQGRENDETDAFYTIVGVAPDFYLEGDIFGLAPEAIYFPLAQRPSSAINLMIRTQGDPLSITPSIRELVASIDPDLPISQVNVLGQNVRDSMSFFTIFGVMFTVFGVAALFLASVGLYGVLSFSVNQRTHELGVRVALGASPGGMVRLVVRQAATQLAIGMAIGMVLSVLLGRAIAFVLFDVAATDVGVLASVFGLLAATGIVACVVPARRATRVDPIVALQAEIGG